MKFPLCEFHSAMRSYWRKDWAKGYPATVDREQCTECIYRKSPEYQEFLEAIMNNKPLMDMAKALFSHGDKE